MPEPANKPAWTAQLAADLQSNEGLTQFQTISDLGKAFVDLSGKASSSVQIPGEGASEKDIADFYAKLGRPDSPDKYDLKRPELPDGVPYDEEAEKFYRTEFHKAGFTQKQMETAFNLHNQRTLAALKASREAQDKAVKEAESSLRREWGKEFDQKFELAKRAAFWSGGQALRDELARTGIGNNPLLVKAFAMFGSQMSEDKLVTGQPPAPPKPEGLQYPNSPTMGKSAFQTK